MTLLDQPVVDPDAIKITHGECSTDDFCKQCREAYVSAPKLLGESRSQLASRRYDVFVPFQITCPFCLWVKAITQPSNPSSVAIYNAYPDLNNRHWNEICLNAMLLSTDGPYYRYAERYLLQITPGRVSPGPLEPDHGHQRFSSLRALKRAYWSRQSTIVQEGASSTSEITRPPQYRQPRRTSYDVQFMRKCITDCQNMHMKSCAALDSESISRITSSNLHLIDCEHRTIVRAQGVPEYVALSYVWGETQKQDNNGIVSKDDGERVLPRDLPDMIADAVRVTLQLGFRYLWVDKYCILQSIQHGDLQRQLGTMDSIYNCAVVTIIAASGTGANSGLPGVSSKSRISPPCINIDGITWVTGFRDTQKSVDESVWATRGWTYQEDYFARRRLVFTDVQVLFECNTCRRNESVQYAMSAEQDLSTDIFGVGQKSRRQDISLQDHISLFTGRNLTYQSDALNALQGVFASFLRKEPVVKQLWGIPIEISNEKDMHFRNVRLNSEVASGLTWDSSVGSTSTKRRAGFPSWSWAGWITPIEFLGLDVALSAKFSVLRQDGTSRQLTSTLIDSIVQDENNKTSIYTYNLCVTAEVTQVRFHDTWKWFSNTTRRKAALKFRYAVLLMAPSNDVENYWRLNLNLTIEDGDELHNAICRHVFHCILLTSEYGIVVRELDGVNERIGLLELRGRSIPSEVREEYAAHNDSKGQHFCQVYPGTVRDIVLG